MKTIWKYALDLRDEQSPLIPRGAELLSVHMQDGTPTVWALVDPKAERVPREIAIRGTGNPALLPDAARFLGTVLDRAYVWHVFDCGDLR